MRRDPRTAYEKVLARIGTVVGDGCWEWPGARIGPPDRYGFVHEHLPDGIPRRVLVHRVMAEAVYGSIPADMIVMHLCDNPPCCNPAHLRIATQRENILDAEAKGRKSSRAEGLLGAAKRKPRKGNPI